MISGLDFLFPEVVEMVGPPSDLKRSDGGLFLFCHKRRIYDGNLLERFTSLYIGGCFLRIFYLYFH
jgi:hypothetical protein